MPRMPGYAVRIDQVEGKLDIAYAPLILRALHLRGRARLGIDALVLRLLRILLYRLFAFGYVHSEALLIALHVDLSFGLPHLRVL